MNEYDEEATLVGGMGVWGQVGWGQGQNLNKLKATRCSTRTMAEDHVLWKLPWCGGIKGKT